jgi:GR25 family glycosyltransferase involved in LPS biosynthesis
MSRSFVSPLLKMLNLCSDYIYVLRECLENTDAPYIAIFEDDIVFAEAWLAKTMNSLAELRQRSQSWLYLRLFYTETSLGWQASDDFWYGHQLLTFTLAMTAVFLFLLLGKRTSRCLSRRLDTATLLILVLIATPAFTLLGFMIGKYNLQPLMGVERMDKHGCCTQALVFPRSQVPSLISFLHGRQSGQTDSLIEEHADAQGYERYALAPQVVQHIGLISSRNNLAVNTRSTWAFWFEAQDPLKLKEEHERLARSGIWRTTSDGIQMPNSAGT